MLSDIAMKQTKLSNRIKQYLSLMTAVAMPADNEVAGCWVSTAVM